MQIRIRNSSDSLMVVPSYRVRVWGPSVIGRREPELLTDHQLELDPPLEIDPGAQALLLWNAPVTEEMALENGRYRVKVTFQGSASSGEAVFRVKGKAGL